MTKSKKVRLEAAGEYHPQLARVYEEIKHKNGRITRVNSKTSARSVHQRTKRGT